MTKVSNVNTNLKLKTTKGFGDLPDGWQWILLSEVTRCEAKTVRPLAKPHKLFSYLGLEDVASHQWNNVNYRQIPGEFIKSACIAFDSSHILYAKLRPYLNKVFIPDKSGVGSTEWIPIKVTSTYILREYLAWFLRSPAFVSYASRNVIGARMPRIRTQALWNAPVPIPFPNNPNLSLDIQHRIVSRIESLLGELKGDHQLLDKMRRDTSRVMEATLTELIKELDKKYPDSPTIGELLSKKYIKILGGGTPSTENEEYWGGSIPWTSPRDMKRWYIDTTQKYISQTALQDKKLNLVPECSVLIVVRGMILAHTLPVGVTKNEVTINQDMKALVPEKNLLSEYLGYILRARAPFILQQVETAAHGTRRLKTDTLKNVVIPIISISEQRSIIEYLNFFQAKVYEMEKIMQQDAQLLERLEQSILEKAFQGKL